MKTKERISTVALKQFNERGFHHTSMRDLAALLKISPGNLSYHYPSKEKLVLYHFQTYRDHINAGPDPQLAPQYGFGVFLNYYQQLFEIQIQFKYCFENLGYLLASFSLVQNYFSEIRTAGDHLLYQQILHLTAAGQINLQLPGDELTSLTRILSLLHNFWISDAIGAKRSLDWRDPIRDTLRVFQPYKTKSGKDEISGFFR